MELITVTKESDPELFSVLKDICEIDTGHIPKHGKGYVTPKAELEDGRKFVCSEVEWDYSWGIEWEYVDAEFTQVEEFIKTCSCCGQLIE